MHIVVIGDVGVIDSMIHIGDEAMFESLVNNLRARGVDRVTGISAQPSETAMRYGIDAIEPVRFSRERASAQARRELVIRTARGEEGLLDADDAALAVIAAVRQADGVVIAGGGNMTSLWPHHVFERATLGAVAAALGRPLVVTGQTIGPELDDDDAALIAELLSSARLVGVREESSLALVRTLGIAAQHTIDDASYLVDDLPDRQDYCLVSLAGHVGNADKNAVVLAFATLLDSVVQQTGLAIRFLAHFGSLHAEQSLGDSLMHDRVIAAMVNPAAVVTPTDSVAAARLARTAALIVSSRYHPVVFAVPAGVPTLGVPVDEYTGVKLSGALRNFGQTGLLPLSALLKGEGPDAVSDLWGSRAATHQNAARLSQQKHAASVDWFDRVVAALADSALPQTAEPRRGSSPLGR